MVVLQFQATQDFLTWKAVNYLESQTGTTVAIERFSLRFPKSIVVHGVYVEDLQKDTLLYGGNIAIDISMMRLFRKEIKVNHLSLEHFYGNIYNSEADSTFNYAFLIEAFAGEPGAEDIETPRSETSDTAAQTGWNVILDAIRLIDIRLNYLDAYHGEEYRLVVGTLNLDFESFDLATEKYHIRSLKISDSDIFALQTKPTIMSDPAADTTPIELDLDIGSLQLENINFEYKQIGDGINLSSNIGHFSTSFESFKLDSMRFDLNDLVLENGYLNFSQLYMGEFGIVVAAPREISETPALLPDIGFNSLKVSEFAIEYLDELSDIHLDAKIGHLELVPEMIDLNSEEYLFETLVLHNSDINFVTGNQTGKLKVEHAQLKTAIQDEESTTLLPELQFTLGTLDLKNNRIRYSDNSEPELSNEFDYNHIDLDNFDLEATNIALHGGGFTADISNFTFEDKSGFALKTFRANVVLTETTFDLKDLLLETNNSRISRGMSARFSSLENAINAPEDIELDINLLADIGFADLEFFSPELLTTPPLSELRRGDVNFEVVMQGKLGNLTIDKLQGSMLSNTSLLASGKISGLPETDGLIFDLKIDYLRTTDNDLKRLLPDTLIPEGFRMPGQYELKATIAGTPDSVQMDATLLTERGNIAAKGLYRLIDSIIHYRADVEILALDLGYMLKMGDTLGKLSMQANIDGSGTTLETIDLEANIHLDSLRYSDYLYKSLEGHIVWKDMKVDANLISLDENLMFTLEGNADLTDTLNPVFDFYLDAENIDLMALNLSDNVLQVQFNAHAQGSGANIENIRGDLSVRDFEVVMDTLQLSLDSFILTLNQDSGNTELKLVSDFILFNWESNFPLANTGEVIYTHLYHYLSWLEDSPADEFMLSSISDTLEVSTVSDANNYVFSFDAEILDPSFITEFLAPEFDQIVPRKFEGDFNSQNKQLNIDIDFPKIVYSGIEIEALLLQVSSDETSIDYLISIGSIGDTSLQVKNIELEGDIAQDRINTALTIYDNDSAEQFILGGTLELAGDSVLFSFAQEQMLLNYEQWDVAPQNLLVYSPSGITAQQFIFSREGRRFGLENMSDDRFKFMIENFDLAELAKIVDQEDDLVEGTLNANAIVTFDESSFDFTAEINIDRLYYMQQLIGNVELLAANRDENLYELDLDISYTDYHARARGFYTIKEDGSDELDFDVDILNLNLAIAEPFAREYIEDLNGNLTGTLKVAGSSTMPLLNGELVFSDVGFTFLMINNRFTIEQERILFDAEGVHFDKFTLNDPQNNQAVLDGSLYTSDFSNYRFNLDLSATNFRAVDSETWVEDMYRGLLVLDVNLSIRGDLDLPRVNGDIIAKNNTNFAFMVPADEAGLTDMEGIVVFIDPNEIENVIETDTVEVVSNLTGVAVNVFLKSERNARFAILMDPTGNDVLNIRGLANLNFAINPAGVMSLSGRYEIVAGTYQLAFMGVVNRRFDIDPGSSLLWSGDPYAPILDIRAMYNVRASPYNLLDSRMAEVPPQARQTFPFTVQLIMRDNLTNPDLSFGIELPEDARGAVPGLYPVILELNQEQQVNELNKQVFSLLVMNTFLAQDPLAGGSGGSTTAAARRSVSNLLSQQLNRLADRYITGFDLNIGVESYEDYSTGDAAGRTEVQLGVSRRFLDNRLTVELGGSVDVEGDYARDQQGFSDIAGNISVAYNITKDGRFRARGFREQTFENVIDGQLIQTGIGLIYVRDYNRLVDLLSRNKSDSN